MSRPLMVLGALVALMPLAFEIPDTTEQGPDAVSLTRVRAAGGYTSYAFFYRDCVGRVQDRVPIHALDGAVQVDQRFPRIPLAVGVRTGTVRDRIGHNPLAPDDAFPSDTVMSNRYVNPYLTLITRHVDVGFGHVFHERRFMTTEETSGRPSDGHKNDWSGHLTVRLPGQRYVEGNWMENLPLYSGGGYLTLGAGMIHPQGVLDGYLGWAFGGPIDGATLVGRIGYSPLPDFRLELQGQGGSTGGSAAIALEYRLVARRRHP